MAKDFVPLRLRDAQAYIDEKAPGLACPICGKTLFGFYAVVSDPEGDTVQTQLPTVGNGYIPAATLQCDSCGYLMSFTWDKIIAWRDAR